MKGICFKEPLFLKVVAGQKTQTRRICKPQPVYDHDSGYVFIDNVMFDIHEGWDVPMYLADNARYQQGEIIYLKEPYFVIDNHVLYQYGNKEAMEFKLKNKLFMPEEYARYYIKITDVKAERLIDISKADAIAEGMTPEEAFTQFANTWKEIHGVDSWADNPWVWKYVFELTNKH
jgi:hypothetical protein